jgi:hypothetical protein
MQDPFKNTFSYYYEHLNFLWKFQAPNSNWDFDQACKAQCTLKACREAETIFKTISLGSILGGAFAYKYLSGALKVLTVALAGITLFVCQVLNLFISIASHRLETWKNLPDTAENVYLRKYLEAIIKSDNSEELSARCEELRNLLNFKVVEYNPKSPSRCLTFLTQISLKNKPEILWESNKRELLIAFPLMDTIENKQLLLKYVEYIQKQILTSGSPTKYNNLVFYDQFMLLTRDQNHWEGIKWSEDKETISFIANYFPTDDLIKTCQSLVNVRIEIFINPGMEAEEDRFKKLQKFNHIVVTKLSAKTPNGNESR